MNFRRIFLFLKSIFNQLVHHLAHNVNVIRIDLTVGLKGNGLLEDARPPGGTFVGDLDGI